MVQTSKDGDTISFSVRVDSNIKKQSEASMVI